MKIPFGSYEAMAAQFVAALDEHVGPTRSMAKSLGVDECSVMWLSFRAGYYLHDAIMSDNGAWRIPVCRPNLAAYAAGAMARVAMEMS